MGRIMTSNVPDAAQVISQVGSVPYNFVSSTVTASGLIGEATQAAISSISFELFSSVYSGDTTFIDDQSFIASCNRGPITTAFIHLPSCTDTLRNEQDMLESPSHFGNWNSHYDIPCFPTGTMPAASLPWANWRSYYCMFSPIQKWGKGEGGLETL